ncbi:uncharacterized protein [Nerophis lumbriciformis]|uniref:uncharacterized protein n=1 Tax=Nerophis lumbriciformis TaxID=546530 RepID=UPI003BA947D2
MGCSTSSQTSAVDSTRPGTKPEESNGTSTIGAANGNIAEDSETIPDQTPADASKPKPEGEDAANETIATAPPAGAQEELQLTDVEAPPVDVPEVASPIELADAAPEDSQVEAAALSEHTEEAPSTSE